MPRKTAKHKIIVTTERVIQTRNEIHVSDEELAVLRACGGGLNKDVLVIVDKHSKDKARHVSTKSIWRCEIEDSGADGKVCLAKWGTDDIAGGSA